MKLLNVYATIAVLLLSLQSIAQKNDKVPDKSQFKRLYIGDTVPMDSIIFNNVRNYPGGKAKLSDFKGKYIILDFWTKGCSVCIAKFPEMEKLQNQFKNDIQILLVTKNSEDELASLLKNSQNVRNTKLPIIIGDQILAKQLFPHGTVPYHVWLDREGKVVATTWAQETTAKNLKRLVTGESIDSVMVRNEKFPVRNHIASTLLAEFHDPKKSLTTIDKGNYLKLLRYYVPIPTPIENSRLLKSVSGFDTNKGLQSMELSPYYSMFMSYNIDLEGLAFGAGGEINTLLNQQDIAIGLKIQNVSLDALYRFAYVENVVDNISVDDFKKIIVEPGAKLFYEEMTDTTNEKRYMINNSYCYESCIPEYTLEKAKNLLKKDLIRFTGLMGSVEERPMKHLILTRLGTKEEKNIWMKNIGKPVGSYKNGTFENGVYKYNNVPFQSLVSSLQAANKEIVELIVIDESGLFEEKWDRKIDISLHMRNLKATEHNVSRLRRELAKYGVGLKEEIRNTKVLLLKASI